MSWHRLYTTTICANNLSKHYKVIEYKMEKQLMAFNKIAALNVLYMVARNIG